jgi:hypothetical protein
MRRVELKRGALAPGLPIPETERMTNAVRKLQTRKRATNPENVENVIAAFMSDLHVFSSRTIGLLLPCWKDNFAPQDARKAGER